MASTPLDPTAPRERQPILDLLRGFALLGILLVNIELMRGPDFYEVMGGRIPEPSEGADRVVGFLTAWLAQGKFISSFAILFGVGAALIVGRALRTGHGPRGPLAKRYAWLMVFGVAHMVLLFPGDILFLYGLTGMALLAFVTAQQRTVAIWSGVLITGFAAIVALFTWASALISRGFDAPADDPFMTGFERFFIERGEAATRAHLDGSYLDVLATNAFEALLVQGGQLFALPWILGLFLFGFLVGRSGIVVDPDAFRPQLRRAALLGLGVGLPLSFSLGAVDPVVLLAGGGDQAPWLVLLIALGQQLGAPILAVGYLATLTLLCLRWRPPRALAAVGRMALTAYLAQSVLALIVFAGFSQYGQLEPAGASLVVVGIWAVLLVACPLWLRFARFGPVEWLWRTLTYGRGVPLRAAERAPATARSKEGEGRLD